MEVLSGFLDLDFTLLLPTLKISSDFGTSIPYRVSLSLTLYINTHTYIIIYICTRIIEVEIIPLWEKKNRIIFTVFHYHYIGQEMGLRDIGETLPPGFKFYPSDEELVCHYLHKKITNEQVLRGTLVEIDLHVCEPWQLPGRCFLFKLLNLVPYRLGDDNGQFLIFFNNTCSFLCKKRSFAKKILLSCFII